MTSRTTYEHSNTNVRNRDFVVEYKQSVFWHTSLGLNRRFTQEFWDCFTLSKTSLHADQLFKHILNSSLYNPCEKTFIWQYCIPLEWCKYNPQLKSLTTLFKHYEKWKIHSLFNGYHSWCLYTHHFINIEWDNGLSAVE